MLLAIFSLSTVWRHVHVKAILKVKKKKGKLNEQISENYLNISHQSLATFQYSVVHSIILV